MSNYCLGLIGSCLLSPSLYLFLLFIPTIKKVKSTGVIQVNDER
ncbi:hypothetical protein RO3G_16258 [Rhizopus delemar RA 99-880]|uniref:Uncharacterized protein n=1 Tax=Rhizopus delemar (strain RA 99-880 / ATCC MYA-4621 / FGSC 9543 / NRRL 43880) TaxID=246409 RepID=I1CSW7_RHIO9|nr:hypothetical protein RO3G_16258 [Rhizopus delemar RA 99-880]|eukprot:EIE91547.1 hypothetical protein RO3G_16258 [Rhizopus delemar RA 99-880]